MLLFIDHPLFQWSFVYLPLLKTGFWAHFLWVAHGSNYSKLGYKHMGLTIRLTNLVPNYHVPPSSNDESVWFQYIVGK